LLKHVTTSGGELGEVLGDRVRELIARSSRIARQSAILVGASQHRRADEGLMPQCAWCGKVRVGGQWTLPEELPDFLADHLDDRRTHGICPDCFAAVERDAGAAGPLARTAVLVRTDGPLAVECLFRALRDYHLRERPDFVLEATLPDAGGSAVNAFLSVVSRCLAEYRLDPVTIELSDRTYVLGESTDTQQPIS
jgi:hypothetical protein